MGLRIKQVWVVKDMSGEKQTPAKSERLSDKAYAQLREDIISCKIEPGTVISETKLSERLKLGKAPLRTALARLSQEGLIVAQPRRGYVISPVTIRDVEELFGLRLILERESAKMAAGKVDIEKLGKLNEICAKGYIPGNRESEHKFLRGNTEFHIAVAEATGNRRLAQLTEQLLNEIERLQHVGMTNQDRSKAIQHEHTELMDALACGDGEAAAAMVSEQILDARQMVFDALMDSDSIRDIPLNISHITGKK